MNGKILAQTIRAEHRIGWLIAILIGGLGVWSILRWFDQVYAANLGWLWLTTLTMVGGLMTHLYQHRRSKLTGCSIKPQIRPLQVTCLAAQALGIQWLQYAETPDFVTVLPFLAWPGWPYACIIAGVAGLGWLSLFCNCRDELLQGHDR